VHLHIGNIGNFEKTKRLSSRFPGIQGES